MATAPGRARTPRPGVAPLGSAGVSRHHGGRRPGRHRGVVPAGWGLGLRLGCRWGERVRAGVQRPPRPSQPPQRPHLGLARAGLGEAPAAGQRAVRGATTRSCGLSPGGRAKELASLVLTTLDPSNRPNRPPHFGGQDGRNGPPTPHRFFRDVRVVSGGRFGSWASFSTALRLGPGSAFFGPWVLIISHASLREPAPLQRRE